MTTKYDVYHVPITFSMFSMITFANLLQTQITAEASGTIISFAGIRMHWHFDLMMVTWKVTVSIKTVESDSDSKVCGLCCFNEYNTYKSLLLICPTIYLCVCVNILYISKSQKRIKCWQRCHIKSFKSPNKSLHLHCIKLEADILCIHTATS